eukprot:CAMPEP_0174293754 /NCGR_PEP_ID=MMETSP0809-20121228/39606_1 /TAXON_ID=73025 ORGANISM="Eutreptiella gymnastica-like, Strain CCMP1594" /NCGR_SAMPLE_ID=MMETSP0809 /ASSEMBLY_ACC=CAM_ASM_000658 /LENGTH=137 /DNA_ID=CAMNT_0015394775 /DNA_START=23 /DNA_END=436 /DNA_ORIENTATION=+
MVLSQKQIEEFQRKLNVEVKEIKDLQTQGSKLLQQRTQMAAQQNENDLVKQELDLMEEDASVYKLIGPVLVQQDKEDATSIVEKRLEYINGEMKRLDKQLKDIEEKQEVHKKKAMEIQQAAQAAAQKAAHAAAQQKD